MKVDEFARKALYFGIGLAAYSKEKIENVVKEMVEAGELKNKEAGEWKEKLMEKAEEEKEAVISFVREQVKTVADELGFVTKDDIEKLKKKVSSLERKVRELKQGKDQ